MSWELHISLLSPLPNNNNHENNTMHLMIVTITKEVDVVEGMDIKEDTKVAYETINPNVLIMMIFLTNNTSVHILEHS